MTPQEKRDGVPLPLSERLTPVVPLPLHDSPSGRVRLKRDIEENVRGSLLTASGSHLISLIRNAEPGSELESIIADILDTKGKDGGGGPPSPSSAPAIRKGIYILAFFLSINPFIGEFASMAVGHDADLAAAVAKNNETTIALALWVIQLEETRRLGLPVPPVPPAIRILQAQYEMTTPH